MSKRDGTGAAPGAVVEATAGAAGRSAPKGGSAPESGRPPSFAHTHAPEPRRPPSSARPPAPESGRPPSSARTPVPEPGRLAFVRSRRWLVEEVSEPGGGEGEATLVHLSCLDDDAQGQPLAVLWEHELDARMLEDDGWRAVARKDFDVNRPGNPGDYNR